MPDNRKRECSTNAITFIESYGDFKAIQDGLIPLINNRFKVYNSSTKSTIKTDFYNYRQKN